MRSCRCKHIFSAFKIPVLNLPFVMYKDNKDLVVDDLKVFLYEHQQLLRVYPLHFMIIRFIDDKWALVNDILLKRMLAEFGTCIWNISRKTLFYINLYDTVDISNFNLTNKNTHIYVEATMNYLCYISSVYIYMYIITWLCGFWREMTSTFSWQRA